MNIRFKFIIIILTSTIIWIFVNTVIKTPTESWCYIKNESVYGKTAIIGSIWEVDEPITTKQSNIEDFKMSNETLIIDEATILRPTFCENPMHTLFDDIVMSHHLYNTSVLIFLTKQNCDLSKFHGLGFTFIINPKEIFVKNCNYKSTDDNLFMKYPNIPDLRKSLISIKQNLQNQNISMECKDCIVIINRTTRKIIVEDNLGKPIEYIDSLQKMNIVDQIRSLNKCKYSLLQRGTDGLPLTFGFCNNVIYGLNTLEFGRQVSALEKPLLSLLNTYISVPIDAKSFRCGFESIESEVRELITNKLVSGLDHVSEIFGDRIKSRFIKHCQYRLRNIKLF